MNERTGQGRIEILGEGRHLRLVAEAGGWEYVQRTRATGVVAVVACTAEGRLLLVEQFRPPIGAAVIELPAGLVGDEDDREEGILEAARRELLEETGYAAERLEVLTSGPTSSGLADETIHMVVAEGLTRQGSGGGIAGERIAIHEIPLDAIDAWLAQRAARGTTADPKIYSGLYLLGRRGGASQRGIR